MWWFLPQFKKSIAAKHCTEEEAVWLQGLLDLYHYAWGYWLKTFLCSTLMAYQEGRSPIVD